MGGQMPPRESIGLLLGKSLLLLGVSVWLLFLALIMGTFATGSPGTTPGERWLAFAILFGLFALPALWPLRAFWRNFRAFLREVHRDD